MTLLWSALLAGGATAALVGLPAGGGLRLEAVLPQARQSWRPPLRLLLVLPVLAVAAVAGAVPGLLLAGVVVMGLHVAQARREAALRRKERARAVEACGGLAAELRAGRPAADALAAAAELACGPSGRALAAAAAAARLGGDVAGALRPTPVAGVPGTARTAAPRPGAAGSRTAPRPVAPREKPTRTAVPQLLEALAACWTVCASSGSGLAAAVERLEEGLRAEQEQRRAIDAELAGPRATALLLAGLPCAGLLLASGLGADPLHTLLETPIGLVCLASGLALDAVGLWWTGRLVARAGGTA